ncbi:hypothetical protein SERLADRAFT_405913 [Serpula lacrymans var. lacrymans S7.9]|uniref:Uncharacterized protein n=1 Tax=Serpula lacrymans var. lacrymans (strain S7.9) TaxID=578457 RepID=F8NK20_SERL9|nr:uncharacterized protein SERLADRAFT_405913 [Serpula lacrymans var. lacrymans S7.9]EGO28332.1 hypothetical protein SERLADRAFT_405913 [Serpula lacrymans var. lacrymans S7.9]
MPQVRLEFKYAGLLTHMQSKTSKRQNAELARQKALLAARSAEAMEIKSTLQALEWSASAAAAHPPLEREAQGLLFKTCSTKDALKKAKAHEEELAGCIRALELCAERSEANIASLKDDLKESQRKMHTYQMWTVGKARSEGGVAAKVQFAHKMAQTENLTVSTDGTSHRHVNYGSRHVSYKVTSYTKNDVTPAKPVVQLLGVELSKNHCSKMQLEGLQSSVAALAIIYNNSPLAHTSVTPKT